MSIAFIGDDKGERDDVTVPRTRVLTAEDQEFYDFMERYMDRQKRRRYFLLRHKSTEQDEETLYKLGCISVMVVVMFISVILFNMYLSEEEEEVTIE